MINFSSTGQVNHVMFWSSLHNSIYINDATLFLSNLLFVNGSCHEYVLIILTVAIKGRRGREFEPCSWRDVFDTTITLCDKVGQWLATGRSFSPDTSVSFSNITNCHDIAEIFLKMALNTINPYQTQLYTSKEV